MEQAVIGFAAKIISASTEKIEHMYLYVFRGIQR